MFVGFGEFFASRSRENVWRDFLSNGFLFGEIVCLARCVFEASLCVWQISCQLGVCLARLCVWRACVFGGGLHSGLSSPASGFIQQLAVSNTLFPNPLLGIPREKKIPKARSLRARNGKLNGTLPRLMQGVSLENHWHLVVCITWQLRGSSSVQTLFSEVTGPVCVV